jgi:hypothetical protein
MGATLVEFQQTANGRTALPQPQRLGEKQECQRDTVSIPADRAPHMWDRVMAKLARITSQELKASEFKCPISPVFPSKPKIGLGQKNWLESAPTANLS